MRQILVDYARSHRAAKRGGDYYRVELNENPANPKKPTADVLALDDALNELSQRDAQQGRIVELRYFGGLTVGDTAEVLDISAATVKRDWTMAKAWISREMGRGARGKTRAVGKD
jgi:RNA polymerase sigma factor (TIGR02999 family)